MRHRSKKKEIEYRERRPLVERLLTERPWCEACPVFAHHDGRVTYQRHPSHDVHELIRRSQGGSILDEINLLAVCRPCHRRIGNYPQLAFDLGLSKHGWERHEQA
jgi:5-methylcytosine-specific restriction endonuclease McrA